LLSLEAPAFFKEISNSNLYEPTNFAESGQKKPCRAVVSSDLNFKNESIKLFWMVYFHQQKQAAVWESFQQSLDTKCWALTWMPPSSPNFPWITGKTISTVAAR
jgi:hypothetical protein